jgi:hypothetical protein
MLLGSPFVSAQPKSKVVDKIRLDYFVMNIEL